jgi:hypothetical protein
LIKQNKKLKMKLIILAIVFASSFSAACDNSHSSKQKISSDNDTTKNETVQGVQDSASIQSALTAYLKMKNALVAGNGKEAADAANSLKAAFVEMGNNLMTASEQKAFTDLADDTKEHAEHIGSSGNDIKHQREHFQLLSKDFYDLVKAFGATQTLYKDYCPMVKAIWLSETKPIKNPYYGSKMLTCGNVQETIQQ